MKCYMVRASMAAKKEIVKKAKAEGKNKVQAATELILAGAVFFDKTKGSVPTSKEQG